MKEKARSLVIDMTLDEKYIKIIENVKNNTSKNPIAIARELMKLDYVSIHGPEHHLLDGVSFLTAYKNSGGNIDLDEAIAELSNRTIKMPGAMCGLWGVCGSVTAIGACLSIINKTSPLSDTKYYMDNMEYTSSVVNAMSKIGGPRCCKRNAFISLSMAVRFVDNKYDIKMDLEDINCEFSSKNVQCIASRCPYWRG